MGAITGAGGAGNVFAPQAAGAAAPAPAAAGANPTGDAIDANMAAKQQMMQKAGMNMTLSLGQEIQQEAQKIEQKNQQRAKEMLAETKKESGV